MVLVYNSPFSSKACSCLEEPRGRIRTSKIVTGLKDEKKSNNWACHLDTKENFLVAGEDMMIAMAQY